jgi:hypothetical protein
MLLCIISFNYGNKNETQNERRFVKAYPLVSTEILEGEMNII